MRLLTPGDERLREEAADRLATVEPQVALPRAQAEQLVRRTAIAATETRSAACRRRSPRGRARGGCGCGVRLRGAGTSTIGMPSPSVVRSQPSAPHCHRLNRRLASERAAAAVAERPAAEIDHVGLSRLRLDEVGVARALQRDVGTMARAQDVHVGMQLVRARAASATAPS